MKLSKDQKMLYNSCEAFVKLFLINKAYSVNCYGDENIQELCNRCPFYQIEDDQNEV